jgi:short-subunit dehydrogenase
MADSKVVVITGASSGMGEAAAKLFASKGWSVFAGARHVEKIPKDSGITALLLDVTDSDSNRTFISAVLAQAGRIDVLINNAGYGEYGPAEEIPLSNARKQFETNFFGAVELTNLVLPAMRKQGSGRIINISSIGGNVYTPLGSFYHATKAALQQWSDVLDMEIETFGLHSIVIQPGGTQSNWRDVAFSNAQKNLAENSSYQSLVAKVQTLFNKISGGTTSANLAEVFYKAATDRKPKLRYFYSLSDRMMVRLAKVHPTLWKWALTKLMKRIK